MQGVNPGRLLALNSRLLVEKYKMLMLVVSSICYLQPLLVPKQRPPPKKKKLVYAETPWENES